MSGNGLNSGRVRAVLSVLTVGLEAVAGCGRPAGGFDVPQPVDDRPMSAVIARVNANAAGADFPIRIGGVLATGEMPEPGGGNRRFEARGVALFHKPRNLYLRLQPTWGTLTAGSNDEAFWVWEQFQESRYYWGLHDEVDETDDLDIPLRPDHLVEVLGLGDLPTDTTGPLGPVFWVGTTRYALLFMAEDAAGQRYLTKKIAIDRLAPHLVRSVVYFAPDGHPLVIAELSDYRPIEGAAALAPHRIRFEWPARRSRVELTFSGMQRFDKPEARERFVPPHASGRDLGEVIRLGTARPTSFPSVPPEETFQETP